MVSDQMMPWPWDKGGQLTEKVERCKHNMGSAVAKRSFKLILHLPIISETQPVETDGRTRDISAESFKTGTLMRLTDNRGVQREAVSIGGERFMTTAFLLDPDGNNVEAVIYT